MSRKLLWGGALAALFLLIGAYLGSPLLAANALRAAAQAGDADKLQRLVDFPAVRESLKGQLNALLMQSIQADPDLKDNPFAGFAAVLAPTLIGQAVESYVTPDGIAAMMAAQAPAKALPGPPAPPTIEQPAPEPAPPAAKVSHAYRDLDTYVITSASKTDPKAQFAFVLHRQGLFAWKLTRIELPKSLAAKGSPAAP